MKNRWGVECGVRHSGLIREFGGSHPWRYRPQGVLRIEFPSLVGGEEKHGWDFIRSSLSQSPCSKAQHIHAVWQ